MSIVISILLPNVGIFLASDHRRTDVNTREYSDDFSKTREVKNNIYFSMTGYADPGSRLLEKLKATEFETVNSLLEFTEHNFPLIEKLDVVLNGINDEGRLFVWTKKGKSQPPNHIVESSQMALTIAASTDNDYQGHFIHSIRTKDRSDINMAIEDSIGETIRYAASLDKAISPTYDLVFISKPN